MKVITLKDGTNETILNDRDLEDLIRRDMGDEVADKIKSLIEVKEDKKIDEENEIRYYEAMIDSRDKALHEVLDIVDTQRAVLLEGKRMNREKITKSLEGVSRVINNEI